MINRNILKDATIRNAKACVESQGSGFLSYFSDERDLKGWDFVENVSLYGVSGGIYFLSANASSPSLSRSFGFANLDASLYTELVIRYKYKKNRTDSIATLGKIQFKNPSDISFTDSKSITFDVIPDDKWHTYYIDVGPVSSWVGLINNVKIFFTTNGQPNDEIFLSYVKIQQPQFKFCSDSCYTDSSITKVSDNFDSQSIGSPPQQYAISNTSTTKTVTIKSDPYSSSNLVLSLNKSTVGSIGPTASKQLDPTLKGFVSFRFLCTAYGSEVVLKKDLIGNISALRLIISSPGEIQYQSGLLLQDLQVPKTISLNTWYNVLIAIDAGNGIASLSINGDLLDNNIPLLNLGLFNGIVFDVPTTTITELLIDDLVILEALENQDCSGLGKQGFVKGLPLLWTTLNVIKDVNDSLYVNINDFGSVEVRLPPGNYNREEFRRALENKISDIDVGGYLDCEVILTTNNEFEIRSGTYGFDSKITVSPTVGNLFNELGLSTVDSSLGRPHLAGFKFLNTSRASTSVLNNVVEDSPGSLRIVQTPTDSSVSIGSKLSPKAGRKNSIVGKGKTIIDYQYRASSNGTINQIIFQGILPQKPAVKVTGPSGQIASNIFNTGITDLQDLGVTTGDLIIINSSGYSGNGSYEIEAYGDDLRGGSLKIKSGSLLAAGKNLTFTIQSIAKVKQFRPTLNGTIRLINETSIGQVDNSLYTRTADSHRVIVSWDLQRGDFIGIYNSTRLFLGNDPNGNPDAVYLEYEGDLIEETSIKNIKGQGVKGIGLYGYSTEKQKLAIYDIEFPLSYTIEHLDIEGSIVTEDIEYNLLAGINQGASAAVTISGTHTHVTENNINGLINEFTKTNTAFNVSSLTDGTQLATNGFLGSFRTNNSQASYFYIDGDTEFGPYVDSEGNSVASLEYPLPGPNTYLFTKDFVSDSFDITFSWNAKKEIYKLKTFFKEYPNFDGFLVEYLSLTGEDVDGTRPNFSIIGAGGATEYEKVKLDNLVLNKTALPPEDYYLKHFEKVFIGFTSPAQLDSGYAQQIFRQFPYTVLEKEFSPVQTSALNIKCFKHQSTKISEIEVLAKTSSESTISEAIELYAAIDESTFQRIAPTVLEDGTTRYYLNFPTKRIRVIVDPTNEAIINSIKAVTNNDLIRYRDSGDEFTLDTVDVDINKGSFSEAKHVLIKNGTGVASDLELSIEAEDFNDSVVVKTSLNSKESILLPDIGPPGILILEDDFDLPTVDNVAVNAKAFGLVNLGANKKYHVSDTFDNESDYFSTLINISKWDKFYTNFPQVGPSSIGERFPGFTLAPPGNTAGAPNTGQNIYAELRSRWLTIGAFSASIVGYYDAGASNADLMGSGLGVVDSTGRKLFIRKRRTFFTGSFTGIRSYSRYQVVDSLLGQLDEKQLYCLGFCTPISGIEDNKQEYVLNITRYTKDGQDFLKFNYIDEVNGNGVPEWGASESFDINLSTLANPLIGPLKVFIHNEWNRSALNSTGTAGLEGSLVRISRFNFGGQSSYIKSYLFTKQGTTSSQALVGVDNKYITLSSVTGGKYVAVDLTKRFNLDIFSIYTRTGKQLWKQFDSQFSNSDVSDVNSVNWGNSTLNDARWILYSVPAISSTSTSGLKYLDYIRVYPDITAQAPEQFTNSIWEDLGTLVSDNNRQTGINQVDNPVFCVRLENQFDISNYQILNESLQEYQPIGSPDRLGWTSGSKIGQLSTSYNITQDPSLVTDWKNWQEYNESNKQVAPYKWFAFKNELFDPSIGGGTRRSVKEFVVSTRGLSSGTAGQVNDRVDFTEYPSWYNVNFSYEKNIGEVSSDQQFLYNSLYSASPIKKVLGVEASDAYEVFDNKSGTYVALENNSPQCWRVFGEVVTTQASGSEITVTGNSVFIVPPQISGNFSVAYSGIVVDGFELSIPDSATGVPDSITIQTFSGSDPTNSAHWSDIFTQTDLSTNVTVGSNTEVQFNGGQPLKIVLSSPLVTSGIKLKVNSVEFLRTQDNTLQISDFKILQIVNQIDSPSALLEKDTLIRQEGGGSLKITYPANNTVPIKITTGGNFNIKPDANWSIQDYLRFYAKIENKEDLDLDNSFIKLGKDSEFHYTWSFRQLPDLMNNQNLSVQKLKFLEAIFKAPGEVDVLNPDRSELESKVDFIKGPLGFFEIELKPVANAPSGIKLWLDNFDIERERFTLSGLNPTLYLNNNESLYFPMSDFDIRSGFFEAVVTPDWNLEGQTTLKKDQIFTIFTAINSVNESFCCVYDSRKGLVFVATNAEEKVYLEAGLVVDLSKYSPIKISVAWDSKGKNLDGTAGSTLKIWLNDKFAGEFKTTWELRQTKDVYFFIGTKASQTDVAINTLSNYPTTVPRKILPETKSISAGIENLIISSRPSKIFFEDIQTLKDKIYISIDGISYYNGNDPNLPFLLYNISPGNNIGVWIKTNLPEDTTNLPRQAFLKAKWRIRQ